MSTDILVVNKANQIASLTLNRPEKRNALNRDLIAELLQALQLIATDEKTRVLIIQGEGEHFCAGGDIAAMKEVATDSYDNNVEDAQMLADLMFQLYSFPKPTIALAHGASLGGGLGLLSACDIVIAAKSAHFGFSEVKLGLTPSTISPYVIAAIGERAAHYYFLTGDRFSADEAHRIGLVQQVTDDDTLLSAGYTLAKKLLLNSPSALKAAKLLIHHVAREKITEELSRKTAEHLAQLRATPEAQEGLAAFVEKRDPKW